MTAAPRPRLGPTLLWLAALASVVPIVQIGLIAAGSLDFPFQLEWMEGGVVETVARLRAGEPIYGPPTVEYVPYIYPPLYFGLGVVSSWVFGVGPLALRVVSLVGTLAALGLLARWVQRLTGRWALGVLAAGAFASTYEASGAFFLVARVDTVHVALFLGAVYALRFHPTRRGDAVAGLLIALAVFAKQSAVIVLAPVGLLLLVRDRRRALRVLGWSLAVALPAAALLEWRSGGWFSFWMLELPGAHEPAEGWTSVFSEHLPRVAVPLVLTVVAGARQLRDRRATTTTAGVPDLGLELALAAGAALASILAFRHSGAYLNVLMPLHAAVALTGVAAIATLARRAPPRPRPVVLAALVAALLANVAALSFPVARYVPSDDARRQAAAYLRELAAIDGDVLVVDQRWIPLMAGKRSYGWGMAARDVLRTRYQNPARERFEAAAREVFASRRFSAVVLSESPELFPSLMQPHYVRVGELDARGPEPVTGWPSRPMTIWRPRDAADP